MRVYAGVWDAERRSGRARAGGGSTSRSTVAARVPPHRQPANRQPPVPHLPLQQPFAGPHTPRGTQAERD